MMKTGMVSLSLIVLVGCSHAQPRQTDPRTTSGADAELFLAVFRGNSNQVALALQHGANIDARHQGLMAAARLAGATPLYAAVFDNKPEIVASLLALGADPTIPNEVGETPLQLAQKRHFAEIVQILTKESSNQASQAIGAPGAPQPER
jgi:ankyrin repeat protein